MSESMSESYTVECWKCGTDNTIWNKSTDAVFGKACGHCGAMLGSTPGITDEITERDHAQAARAGSAADGSCRLFGVYGRSGGSGCRAA